MKICEKCQQENADNVNQCIYCGNFIFENPTYSKIELRKKYERERREANHKKQKVRFFIILMLFIPYVAILINVVIKVENYLIQMIGSGILFLLASIFYLYKDSILKKDFNNSGTTIYVRSYKEFLLHLFLDLLPPNALVVVGIILFYGLSFFILLSI